MSPEPATVVSAWLDAFASALVTGDLTSVFNTEDCWLRDLLVLSRDFTTVQGITNISAYLHEADRRLYNFRLDTRTNNGGVTLAANPPGLTALFRFDIAGDLAATARGCVRLVQQTDGEWRAWTVLLVLQDIVGHEENVGRAPVHVPRDGQTWDEVWEENSASIADDLAVLVVGAGHCGLMMAARLRQMGIKALVIDRAKVGDSWQNRYPSLKLHTPTFMNSFPYHSYPATWPTYLPRSKMSSFLRSYRDALDLFVWESTELLSDPRPTYDDATKRWTVHVNREGDVRILHPRHIVIAIGLNMLPRQYDVPGMADFQGVVYHSAGKRVVVVSVYIALNRFVLLIDASGAVYSVQKQKNA
ncbi:FAD/NAD(P)-binding domain-containing protein [Exidia glandulosa HHB12029]|uniref:FAD/NAD(P)-binding domain-containing protein n=1 Tax=Exidia glandulosa HHB12029 TaxID=1314781 RepID=A0A165JKY2_EXIGL|nr:FAD/NAD(P)-binding domain-containing protein [Exidia glandulosa HHB12029]